MIHEDAVLSFLVFETSGDDGETWDEWTGSINELSANRGGHRSGASSTVEVGTLSVTLINAADPLQGDDIRPNMPARLRHRETGDAVFTGRVADLASSYQVDKATGKTTARVTVFVADSVRAHAATPRYGAVTDGGAGFETWAQRIIRLCGSATTDVNPPEDDSPIVRYAI